MPEMPESVVNFLCYYPNWSAKVMKLRLGFSEACQSLYQQLRNRAPGGLMGIGES